jgi:hypothetical protein
LFDSLHRNLGNWSSISNVIECFVKPKFVYIYISHSRLCFQLHAHKVIVVFIKLYHDYFNYLCIGFVNFKCRLLLLFCLMKLWLFNYLGLLSSMWLFKLYIIAFESFVYSCKLLMPLIKVWLYLKLEPITI